MPPTASDFPSIHAKVVFVSNCGAAGDFTLQGNAQGVWTGSLGGVSVELFLMDGPQMFMSAWYNGQYLITRPGPGLGISYIFGAFGLDTAQCPPAGGSFYVEVDFPETPVVTTPACGCDCDCGCKGGPAGNSGAASENLAPLLPSAAAPTEFSAAPIRYATGEIHLDATDLMSGGFGAAWGHTRSYVSRMYVDGDVGQGFDWQVAEWPYLVAQTDPDGTLATLVLMGHAGKAVWFDVAGDNFVARFGVQLALVHDAPNRVYRLTDQSGNTTLFDDTTLLFKQRTDAAGNQINVVSYIGAKNLGEVQRSYRDGSGNATIESILYSYAAGSDGVNRLSSVLLRRRINDGPWNNVRQAVYTYWDGSNLFGSLGDLKTAQVQSWENGDWNSLGTTLYRYWVAPGSGSSSSSGSSASGSSAASSSSSSSGAAGPAVFNHALKYVVQPDSYARLAADPNAGGDPLGTTPPHGESAPFSIPR
ncbi:MAG: hypothetical protein ACRD2H_16490, partial [Terriglobales bacterium]